MPKKYISGLVSIGLPTYNRADLLKRAVDSLLGQTYQNIELIISDNCSSDGTQKVCQEYAAKDRRVRYHRQKENIGLLANASFVLSEARGEYFMWPSDDDWWDPRFIEYLKKPLDQYPDYGVAMSSILREYWDGRWHSQIIYAGRNDLTGLSNEENFYKMVWPKRNQPLQCVLLGLHRTPLIKKFMSRPYPVCQRHDKVIAGEFALLTKFYTVQEVLFKKMMHDVPPNIRHEKTYGSPSGTWTYGNYYYNVGKKVMLSDLVPLKKKITFLPAYAKLGVMLIAKKTMLRKLPRQFKRIKGMLSFWTP